MKNTILFPLGLASVKSQADSPLLGHVLAQTGVLGHNTIVVILLVGSGLAIAVSLVVRPPRDVPAATIRLVLGLSAMFVLAPRPASATSSTRPPWSYGSWPPKLRLRLSRTPQPPNS